MEVGPGDPAAHRTNRLPLLPSGPGGVHRVLLHRARPRGVCDSTGATGERGWYEASLTITSSQATPDASHLQHGGEGGHSKSRLRAPTEGACPLVSPHAGEYLPRDPPRSNPTASARDGNSTRTLFQSYTARFDGGEGGIRTHGPVAETHAFQACRFVHSRTSPQSDDFKGWHLITQVFGRQGKLVGCCSAAIAPHKPLVSGGHPLAGMIKPEPCSLTGDH